MTSEELKLLKDEFPEELLKISIILLKNLQLNKNYSEQESGSTEAYTVTIPNCIYVEEDDIYVDECYPNSDFDDLQELLDEIKLWL